jgi:hypothetical protein
MDSWWRAHSAIEWGLALPRRDQHSMASAGRLLVTPCDQPLSAKDGEPITFLPADKPLC